MTVMNYIDGNIKKTRKYNEIKLKVKTILIGLIFLN